MYKLDSSMQSYIEQAIHDLELSSYGTVECIVAKSSARYIFFPMILALLLSFIMVPTIELATVFDNYTNQMLLQNIIDLILKIICFIFLLLLFVYTSIGACLTPSFIKKQCAQRFSRELFYQHGLHRATKHAGVLLFISLAEGYCEIIADKGINSVVARENWQEILNSLTKSIKYKKLDEGILYCITQIKNHMVKHFPTTREKTDSNKFVITIEHPLAIS